MIRNCTLFFLLFSSKLYAQKNMTDTLKKKEIDPIVIVGDKAKSIPGAGEYISNTKLEKLNQSNVNNVLRTIPGVNIRDEEGYGLRPNIGLRGTPVNRSAKITLMEDGILTAPAPYADPSAYYFPTFARMQAVEVLKGSSQIKYGPYTIGGAINLLSTHIPHQFRGHALVSYGSFGTNQQRVWIGDSRKNVDYVFEVNRLASNGFKKLDNGDNTGFDRRDFMGKLRWHTSEDASVQQSVTLKLINSTEDSKETYLGLTYDDYNENPIKRYAATQKDKLEMNHQMISINHTILPATNLIIHTTAYFTKTYRDWARANTMGGQSINNILGNPTKYPNAFGIMKGDSNGTIEYQSAARTYHTKGLQSTIQYVFQTKAISHQLQLGLRYHSDEADRYATKSIYEMINTKMILSNEGEKGNQENQIRSANSIASYLSYDIQIYRLKISPGIRYEKVNLKFNNYGNNDVARLGNDLKTATNDISIFLPGIGIVYDLNKNMNVFGGIHKGFSPPGTPAVSATNKQAKMETAINYEIGYKAHFNKINTQIVGFANEYENILGADNVSGGGAGTGDMFNAGKASIKGIEISIATYIMHRKNASNVFKIPLHIAYTYTQANFKETFINGGGDWGSGLITKGDYIPFISPHLLTTSIGVESNQFNITLMGRYVSNTRTKPGKSKSVFPAQNIAYTDVNAMAAFLILDLSANYKISKYFTLFSTLGNITNNKTIVANLPQGYRPNMPINIMAGIKADF